MNTVAAIEFATQTGIKMVDRDKLLEMARQAGLLLR